jgi:hypothetical protein
VISGERECAKKRSHLLQEDFTVAGDSFDGDVFGFGLRAQCLAQGLP